VPHPIDGFGHRDHSWGGERDWNKFYGWDYLNVEFGRDAWFHAVRFELTPGNNIYIGALWDGKELHEGREIQLDIKTADGGTRQIGCDWRMQDERGRAYHIIGEPVLANCVVRFNKTWLKDGIARFRWGERVGYGILEHGYLEET
jgi:predicted secreted hydrolase